jgi:ATP-dependent RNA helicase DHX29
MAPGRKKKKPAVNPARGFATTSTASKSKVIDLDEVEQADSVSTCVPESTDVPGLNQSGTGQETRRDLSDLTPEELEAQLEESDLQLLVEGYSEKSRKESSRHISRLQTERRLLRGQAGKLNTAAWFPPELVQLILDNIEFQESDKSLATPSGSTVSQSNLSTDDLSVKLWTLRRVLNGIGFLEEHSHKAICQLLISSQMMKRANVILGRDNLWGLDAALDWLALSCNPDEIPGYDTQKTEALERIARETIREAVSDISGKLSMMGVNELGDIFIPIRQLCR